MPSRQQVGEVREWMRIGGASAADVVPLSQRVIAMMVVRVVLAAAVAVIAWTGDGSNGFVLWSLLGHLVLTALFSGLTFVLDRVWAVRGFAMALLTDGVMLQIAHEVLGHEIATDLAIATVLVAACLLASFRSGLKVTLWQSLLMVFSLRAEESGLVPAVAWSGAVDRERALASDITLIWIMVLTACVTGAINERELRRRRYDAEALRRFSIAVQTATRCADVAVRLCQFVVTELGGTRALVCHRTDTGWTILAGLGVREPAAPLGRSIGMLRVPSGESAEVLTLTLDPVRDAWLAERLPGARRVIALSMHDAGAPEQWLLLEHGSRRGSRVERRVVGAAAQAVATASLGLSRTRLLERAERAATLDGLTGILNRRAFDVMLATLFDESAATGAPFALVLVDVDRFKSINDTHGHQVGDQVLQVVADTLTTTAAGLATAARYGGEEFALLVPRAGAATATALAERARIALRQSHSPVPVTASFGVALMPEDARDAEALIRRADHALYRAKQQGRDRVVRAEAAVTPSAQSSPR